MAFDNNSLLSASATELIQTRLQEMGPAIDDLICHTEEVEAIKGSFPYFAAADQAGKDLGSQAIGTNPIPVDFELSEITYKLERFSRSCQLDQSEVQDLDQYTHALTKAIDLPLIYNRISRETKLHALMTDSTYNGQQPVANGTWDLASSTPYLDMQNLLLNDVPLVDEVVIGFKTLQELQRHADTKEFAGSYAGGAVANASMVRQAIANVFEIDPEQVIIWKTVANSAAFGQTFALSRVANEFFWAGQRAGLVKVAQKGRQSEVTVETNHLQIDTGVHDTCTYFRADVFAGGEITGL